MFSASISGIARIRIGNADICPCCKYSTNYQIGKIKQKKSSYCTFSHANNFINAEAFDLKCLSVDIFLVQRCAINK